MVATILGSVATDFDNSVSHTLVAGDNRWVLAAITTEKAGDGGITSCTYGGVAMTELEKVEWDTGANENWIAIFGIKEADLPADGANTCTATVNSDDTNIQVIAIQDASQDAPVSESNGVTNTVISKAITTTANNTLLISAVGAGNGNNTFTHGTDQTEISDIANAAMTSAMSWELVAIAGAETESHTCSASSRLVMAVVGFASIGFENWIDVTAGTGTIAIETTEVFIGLQSCKITADADHSANPTYIYQDVTVEEGLEYVLAGYVKGDWKVTITADTNTDTDNGAAANWTTFSVVITADDTTLRVRLEPFDDADVVYFDNLTLTEGFPANYQFTKFIGIMNSIRPSSGQFDFPISECEAQDWIGYLNKQELGIQAIQADKTVDEALTTLLTEFPNQPEATDFDTGVETFELVFAGESDTSSMASMLSKLARNEQGRIYSKGDGTLVFENQTARAGITTSSFTLDGTMSDINVNYNAGNIYNIVSLSMRTTTIDAAATTELFKVGKGIKILAGETLTLICNFTDPDTGQKCAGADVVTPVAAPHFGSTRTPANDDMHASLTDANYSVGGSSVTVELTNTHGATTGYLNEFTVLGKRITEYDSITIEKRDSDSIDQVGNKRYSNRMDLIEDAATVEDICDSILDRYAPSHIDTCRITVLANLSDALAAALVVAEPSTRFTAIESVTGISKDFYINYIEYKQDDTLLWVTIEGQEV